MTGLTRRVVALGGTMAITLGLAACGSSDDGPANTVKLTISANAAPGGKNSEEAAWIEEWVIPQFEKGQREKGVEVRVIFQSSGVDDEQYKTKLALDLQAGTGPDIFGLDGIWIGEFAQAGYIQPLDELIPDAAEWDGWQKIPDEVQELASFDGKRYGIPWGTDGRVLFYNKTLFEKAGLPTDWQPDSWNELLEAGEALAELDGVTPLQLNAGTAMGEATSMQGVLPLLAGTGEEVWADGTWTGASDGMVRTLRLYERIYADGKLGNPQLQQETQGRDKSFEQFADNKIGILAESDYFWRTVLHPTEGVAPMKDRDKAVGYALFPAERPGTAVRGQDQVSMSGGTARVVSPDAKDTELAFELLAFMNSAPAVEAAIRGDARITARSDVNDKVLADDPMLRFIWDEVLPLTSYRPQLAAYPQVSTLLQEATAAVVAGDSPEEAAAEFHRKLKEIVDDDAGDTTS